MAGISSGIFVIPASNPVARRNVEQTVGQPVPSEVLAGAAEQAEVQAATARSSGEGVSCWGLSPGERNERTWNNLLTDDWVLFYQGGRYTYVSRILGKARDEGLAERLWGKDSSGGTWGLVIFLHPATAVDVSADLVSDVLGDTNMGNRRLSGDRSREIAGRYGSTDEFIGQVFLGQQAVSPQLLRGLTDDLGGSVLRLASGNVRPAGRVLIELSDGIASRIVATGAVATSEQQEGAVRAAEALYGADAVSEYMASVRQSDAARALGMDGRRLRDVTRGLGVYVSRGGSWSEESKLATLTELVRRSGSESVEPDARVQIGLRGLSPLRPPRLVASRDLTLLRTVAGYTEGDRVCELSEEQFQELSTPAPAWIFQANPNYYDVRSAVRDLTDDIWQVNQHGSEIRAGDRVYFWESGQQGGIVGWGEILEDVAETTFAGNEYTRDLDRIAGTGPRVPVRILGHLDPPISRSVVKETPGLDDLSILKFGPATNFKVSPSEAAVLESLVVEGASATTVWWVNQGLSYSMERGDGTGYLWAPLLAKDNKPRAYHANVAKVRPGDLVIHYAAGEIKALGRPTGMPTEGERPSELPEEPWSTLGHTVGITYFELAEPVRLAEIPAPLRIPTPGGPFGKAGGVNQGYLFPLDPDVARQLLALFADRWPEGAHVQVQTQVAGGESLAGILAALREQGLRISDLTLRRYHSSLQSRKFVILSGVSGTGKTWLAEAYAKATDSKCRVVSVAPNWTSNEDLLGYFNPFAEGGGKYIDTEFSAFLRGAEAEWDAALEEGRDPQAFHLVLDEMNLARVEYYFAKFLSAMELRMRDEEVLLDLGPDERVKLTNNLYFIGTVNIDETTHGFADKVYDRAQLLEMPLDRASLAEHAGGAPWANDLMAVWDDVHEVAPFAYRVIDEVRSYAAQAEKHGASWREALDEQILQKVLPKLKGGDDRVGQVLTTLLERFDTSMPLSRRKVEHMLEAWKTHGFTSYFEF
jgi:hypothetical protein